jgi:hypothetical protein
VFRVAVTVWLLVIVLGLARQPTVEPAQERLHRASESLSARCLSPARVRWWAVAWYMFVWYMATTSRLSVGAQSLGDDNRHEEEEEEEKQGGVQHTHTEE